MSKTNIIKTSFFVLSALLSFLLWIRFEEALDLVGFWDLASASFLLLLSASVFLLSFFVFRDKTPYFGVGIFLLVFLLTLGFKSEYFLAVFLAFLLFLYARARFEANTKNNIKIDFYSAVFRGVPALISMLAILIAFGSYFYPFSISEIKVSEKSFVYVEPIMTKLVQTQFPFYEEGMSVDDLLAETAAEEVGVSADFIKANYKTALGEQRGQFSESLGVELKGDEELLELSVDLANLYINKFLSPKENLVPIFIAIAVFFTIKSFGFILNRVSVLFAWLMYLALIKSSLIRKELVQVEREVIKV